MRTAIIHYWLDGMRGGEKVVEALCKLIPDADIFTLFYEPSAVSALIRSRVVETSWLNRFRRHRRALLPLMPLALESFDLRSYDLIISSESGPAKGVIASSTTRHICYCHSPMRYLWDLYPAYLNEFTTNPVKRTMMRPLANYLRLWDFASAARVDDFIANSRNVQGRIWKTYRRKSQVVFPPVAIDKCYWKPSGDYYLIVSELVAYKRLDSAIRVCNRTGRKLCIVGSGPENEALRNVAGPNVQFFGRVDSQTLHELYAHSRAFLMPGEEDFGITAVEALASGKPVIALGRGGALETVPVEAPFGGVLYLEQSDEGLRLALESFERREHEVRHSELQEWAHRFSEEEFLARMSQVLMAGNSLDVLSDPAVEALVTTA